LPSARIVSGVGPIDAQNIVNGEVGLDRPFVAADEISLVGFRPMQREAILLRVDRHGTQAELGGAPHDPDGDLATVGDQNATYRLRHNPFHFRIKLHDVNSLSS
jgi:hypothetical protein